MMFELAKGWGAKICMYLCMSMVTLKVDYLQDAFVGTCHVPRVFWRYHVKALEERIILGTEIFQFAWKMLELWSFKVGGVSTNFPKNTSFCVIQKIMRFWSLYPFIQMIITPLFFKLIKKFQCLELSTP